MTTATADGRATRDSLRAELIADGARLIERGLPVIPCSGKVPCDDRGLPADNWQNLPVTIDRLNRGVAAAGEPAIGLIMGPKSRIIDIETDSDDEAKAVAHLFRDCERPIAPAYKSTRGRHDWYRYDDRLLPIGKAVFQYKTPCGKSVKIRLGVNDAGAQSVIPPSPGRAFLPGLSLDDVDPPALPDVVVRRLLDAAKPNAPPRNGKAASGVRADVLAAMHKATSKMVDGNDGSRRLLTCCCRGVELDASDEEITAAVRALEAKAPFPKAFDDAEIAARIRDAEKTIVRGSAVVIANFELIEVAKEGKDGEVKVTTIAVPKPIGAIIDAIHKVTGDWPRRVDNMLFIDDAEHGLDYFDRRTTAGMFGWLRGRAVVKWHKGGNYVSQSELFAETERTAQRYESIELLPHEPAIEGIYYRGGAPPMGDGTHLRWMLDRFRPETTVDRELIQAAFMTAFWGGLPGCRPAFVVTSDDGRGVGKSKVAEAVGYLCGGHIDVSAGEDIETLKTRMLTPAARTKRIALLDNVKSLRLSWAELEAMITAPVISGRQLYVGEGQRPNLLTWFLTLNGVSMATDMAQRSVIIKVVKGKNDGPWWEQTRTFIDQHRHEIIGDIISALRGEAYPPV